MSNTGIEVELNADVIATRDFTWNINLNLAWQRNRVTKLPDSSKKYNVGGHDGFISGADFIGEGLPVNTWYMPAYAGLNEEGRAQFYVDNEDGTVTTCDSSSDASYRLAGSSLPDVFGGFGTSVRAFGFDLSAHFAYSIGGLKYDSGYEALTTAPSTTISGKAFHKDIFNSWTPENTDTDMPLWQLDETDGSVWCDRFLRDASYLTFKSITIGYTFPKSITSKLKAQRLRVFATCDNVYYWSKFKGFDPREGSSYGSYGGFPPLRSISGGINIQF